MLVWALVALVGVTTFTGCATAVKGTSRCLRAESSIPGTQVTLTTSKGREETKFTPAVFHLGTHRDRGDLKLLAVAPDGRYIEKNIVWENHDGKWFVATGGIGWGVVTGVGGLVSLGTDYVTKSYKDLSEDYVYFDFNMARWQSSQHTLPPRKQLRIPPPTLPQKRIQTESDGNITITITRERIE